MKTVFIKTFGCTLNQRDGEDIVTGMDVAVCEKNADILIINTCGVKEQTETKIYKYIRDNILQLIGKEIIVTGCLVDINSQALKTLLPGARLYGVKEKDALLKYLEKYKNKAKQITKKEITKAIIIANGCLGNCSYCAVKLARGKLKSKSIEEVIKEIKTAVKNDAKEILLTAQDTACYGLDINSSLTELLREAVKIDWDFKIRLGMGNPQYLELHKTEIVDIFKSKKLYKFLHIPLQSGSDRILKDMHRNYTKNSYLALIKYFKKNICGLTLATDIIVGYPTETEKEFLETLEVIRECKFDVVNISRFSRRKGIEASRHKELAGAIKKQRSRRATKLCYEIALDNNKKFIGKRRVVVITCLGKNNTSIGRTKEYKQVVVSGRHKLGEKINVKIKSARVGYLIC